MSELREAAIFVLKEPPPADSEEYAHYDMCAQRLARAFLAREAGEGWQDISTAPKDNGWILVVFRTRRIGVVRWGSGCWEDDNRLCRDPTHWMPLPDAPRADGGEGSE